jgi:hypothetical protein
MSTEKQLWKKVLERWPGHAIRVEASEGGVDPGTPDCNLSVNGHGGWVELKVWPEPVSPIQIAWHLEAEDLGASVRLWSQVSKGRDTCLVWSGSAEDYAKLVEFGRRPVGVPLQMVIDRLVRELS